MLKYVLLLARNDSLMDLIVLSTCTSGISLAEAKTNSTPFSGIAWIARVIFSPGNFFECLTIVSYPADLDNVPEFLIAIEKDLITSWKYTVVYSIFGMTRSVCNLWGLLLHDLCKLFCEYMGFGFSQIRYRQKQQSCFNKFALSCATGGRCILCVYLPVNVLFIQILAIAVRNIDKCKYGELLTFRSTPL